MKIIKPTRAWAGVVGTRIHTSKEADSGYKIMAIYKTRRTAKLAYECVVPVVIKEAL